jgi:hypothetical protein
MQDKLLKHLGGNGGRANPLVVKLAKRAKVSVETVVSLAYGRRKFGDGPAATRVAKVISRG